jgi:hypothetical protein
MPVVFWDGFGQGLDRVPWWSWSRTASESRGRSQSERWHMDPRTHEMAAHILTSMSLGNA